MLCRHLQDVCTQLDTRMCVNATQHVQTKTLTGALFAIKACVTCNGSCSCEHHHANAPVPMRPFIEPSQHTLCESCIGLRNFLKFSFCSRPFERWKKVWVVLQALVSISSFHLHIFWPVKGTSMISAALCILGYQLHLLRTGVPLQS